MTTWLIVNRNRIMLALTAITFAGAVFWRLTDPTDPKIDTRRMWAE